MKLTVIVFAFVGCIVLFGCGKKGDATPTPHTIKVTVAGTASYSVSLSAIKAEETVSTALDTKTIASGTYEFTTTLTAGSVVHLEVQNSNGENTVAYAITDNDATGTTDSGRELGSFSKIVAEYTVR
ncbi:hypothetical protein [Mucilaginibacter pedocola]|nr:hypothetical protein [Mucilaginibacter pedocola]